MPLFLRRGAEPVDGGAQPLDGLVPAHHAGQVHAAAGGALLARQGDAQGVQQPAVLVLHPLGQSLAGVEQAILNYICLLGWSPKGEYAEQEIFSLPELVRIWDPAGISKSPAIFDPLKLRAINAEYIRRLSPEEFRRKAEPWIDSAVHCPGSHG